MNLNYRMQNILSTQENRTFQQAHQLQANSTAEVIDQSVYLQTRATAGQTLVNPRGRQTTDNLSNTGNRANFYTVSVSPYWLPHFGGYADGAVRLRYDYTTTSSGQASDTQNHTESVFFRSGRRFSLLNWQIGAQNRESIRTSTSGQNVQFRNAFGQVSYRWHRKFSTFVQGGWQDNSFRSRTNTNNNGLFYTVGATWTPSRMLMLQAGGGNNSFATIRIQPSRRTLLQGTYRRNNVGTNTGDVFFGLLQHRTRHTLWQGQYFEDTTTTQTVLAEQQIFLVTDQFGNPVLDPVTNQPALVAIDLPQLVDEVFVRKRGQLSFTGFTAKHTFNARVFVEKRTFQVQENDSDILGFSGGWNWRWGTRTNASLFFNWQQSDFTQGQQNQGDLTNTFWTTSFRITRRLTPDVNAYLQYLHSEQTSDSVSDLDFQENRAVAAIAMTF